MTVNRFTICPHTSTGKHAHTPRCWLVLFQSQTTLLFKPKAQPEALAEEKISTWALGVSSGLSVDKAAA